MSLLQFLSCHLILTLSVLTGAKSADDYYIRRSRCIYSSPDYSDMVYIDSFYLNKFLFTQFNSTLRKFVGFSEIGMRFAERWNDSPFLESERAGATICKFLFKSEDTPDLVKVVKPKVKLRSVKQAGGRHPAVLMCSAYEFYPPHIKVSWLRDGKPVTSEVTSTMEMANGDWYYQIHSDLEYTPRSGEKISCMVEHDSFNKPMIYDWDPSLQEYERNKVAIGASGLVLGIIFTATGLIYFKKKSTGRVRVPQQ
ncbi:rano class II histocompatibility antigen, A beta chain-like [Carassius auratus]|uniref:Rano class II histocompatibility antigen, A beta chain-like n=1 Tax=Carassius auratus TaxID=7957 RepID=A0A6P6JWF4_CARAU|nr:rano class II histocompatibility antigen, A beta chain-like [Carassius auratus]